MILPSSLPCRLFKSIFIGQIRCQEVDLREDEEVDRPEEGADLSGGEEIALLLGGQYLDAVVDVGVVVNLHVVGLVQNNPTIWGGASSMPSAARTQGQRHVASFLVWIHGLFGFLC